MRQLRTWAGLIGLALVFVTVAADGWSGEVDAASKVRIGVLLPLSGPVAVNGQNTRRGYDLAIEDINKAGGIKSLGGAEIELVYGDHQGKQDVAIGETERLIEREKVAAIM